MLFRRFSDLAIDIRTTETTDKAAALADWTKKRISIESDEPPTYWALEADCDNEVRRAWGRDEELISIGWWSRLTMNWLKHAQSDYTLVRNQKPTASPA